MAQSHAQRAERPDLVFQASEFLCRVGDAWRPRIWRCSTRQTWDKYQLTKLTGGKYERNTFLNEQKGAAADPKDYENPDGVFSPHNNSIPALQRRGVVFIACHNAIWETSEKLIAADVNPDKLSLDAMAAELTNHLIPSAVLTPGAVGTLPELAAAGFSFAK